MHLAYKFLVAALALTGSMSLLLTGELNPVFVMPGLAMIPGYFRYLKDRPPANRWVIAGLALVEVFVVVFDTIMVSGDFFIAVAHMTIIFQALKSFDLREPWDPLQVYFMALLQLIITSELTLSIAMGAVFAVFLFIFMAAMVFSHFMKEGTLQKVKVARPLVTISLVALAATMVFFVSMPRVRAGIWGRENPNSTRSEGFSENVDFGSLGEVLEDSTIVMRVELSGRTLPLYWRGVTLDSFNGVSWRNSFREREIAYRSRGRFIIRPVGREDTTVQKVIVEPMDTDVVFGLGEIVAVESRGWGLRTDNAGSVYFPAKNNRRFSYTVYSRPRSSMPVEHVEAYLALSEGMERISSLARSVSSEGRTDLAKANLIESFLRNNYVYSLKTDPPREGMTPMEDFLFSSRKGFCEHFATAMVLMLRSEGIPSRIVTGFVGGEENDDGDYVIVRQSNAHSWVEAAVNGRWRRFDPTPLAPPSEMSYLARAFDTLRLNWYRYVVGFSALDQRRMLRSFSTPVFTMPEIKGVRLAVRPAYVILIVSAVLVSFAVFLFRGLRFRRYPFETKAYLDLRKKLKKKGGRVGPSSTAEDVLREARRLSIDGDSVEAFLMMYEEARFGGKKMDAQERKRYRELAGI